MGESSVAPGREFNRHSPTSSVQSQPAYASPETSSYLVPSGQVMFGDPTNSAFEVEQSADDVSTLESILTFGGLSYVWAGVVWGSLFFCCCSTCLCFRFCRPRDRMNYAQF